MNLSISGRHLEITPAIREYTINKMGRIGRHFDNVIDTQVMLSVEKLQHTAEVTVRLPGKDIHCEARDENLYASIDLLRSEEHTSELQSRPHLVCRLLLEKKKKQK